MGRSIDIEKQALIERINEIDDIDVLKKLRKILFGKKTAAEKADEPCAISKEELKSIIKQDSGSCNGVLQSDFIARAMQWR